MRKRLPQLAQTFICKRQIVMRVGVGRGQPESRLVSSNCLRDAAGFVQNISQVEIGQGVARICRQRGSVMFFGARKVLSIVVESAQVDVRRRVGWFNLKQLMVKLNGLVMGARMLFQLYGTRKQVSYRIEPANCLDLR